MADDQDDYEPDEEPDEGGKKRRTPLTAADDEQAEWLAGPNALNHGVVYDHSTKKWHIWNPENGIWARDETKQVQRMVFDLANEFTANEAKGRCRQTVLKQYRSLRNVPACERALIALSTRPDYKTDGNAWDTNAELLGCENGIVDLTKNALLENPGPGTLVSRSTGHDFVPFEFDRGTPEAFWGEAATRAPRFMKFLDEITSDDREQGFFYLQWFGYALFGHSEEQKFLILTGTGRNGKSVLCNLMDKVFGEYAGAADRNLYMRSRFGSARSEGPRADLVELKNRRLLTMSEPDGGVFNEGLLKEHVAGIDKITARALHSNVMLRWWPSHTINFLTNDPPKVDDIGPSMSARVRVADFNERFEGAREDRHLGDKLAGEAPGVLAILCQVAQWWHQDGGIHFPERVMRASAEYMLQNDPLGRFIDEACVVEPGAKGRAQALYDAYTDWHARSDEEGDPLTLTAFGTKLVRKGFNKVPTNVGKVYPNIRPKSAVELADALDDEA